MLYSTRTELRKGKAKGIIEKTGEETSCYRYCFQMWHSDQIVVFVGVF